MANIELKQTTQTRIDRLVKAATRAVRNNAIDLGPMVSPPTIPDPTISAPAGFSTLYAPDAALTLGARDPFTYYGPWANNGGAAGSVVTTYGQGRISFMTDSAKPSFKLAANNVNASARIGLLVDGQYVNAEPFSPVPSGGAQVSAHLTLDFGGVKALRRIEMDRIANIRFYGVTIASTDSIFAPERYEPNVIMISDSFGGNTGAPVNKGLSNIMGRLNGWNLLWDYGSPGGGGYVAQTASGGLTNLDRIAGVAAQSPDGIIIASGVNDATTDATALLAITAAARTYYTALRAQNPGVPIVVVGPWGGATGPNTANIATENAILTAFNAWGDPLSRFIRCSTAVKPILFGTGKESTPNGTGNADFYMGGSSGTDATHPNTPGHNYLGRWLARVVLEAFRSMAA